MGNNFSITTQNTSAQFSAKETKFKKCFQKRAPLLLDTLLILAAGFSSLYLYYFTLEKTPRRVNEDITHDCFVD